MSSLEQLKEAALASLRAICVVFALAFGVWCYFAIKSARERKRRAGLSEYERINEDLYRSLTAPRPPVESAPMYRHRGHIHAKRGPNRADRRAAMVPEPGDGYFDGGVTGGKS